MFNVNYFSLMKLPQSFRVDLETLHENYQTLQKTTHPDRFVTATDQEKRNAAATAAEVNSAYNTLKSPLTRAQYLLSLSGHQADGETTIQDPEFLLEQMELRDELEQLDQSSDPIAEITRLRARVTVMRQAYEASLEQLFLSNSDSDLRQASVNVNRLRFVEKLLAEIDVEEDRLDDLL